MHFDSRAEAACAVLLEKYLDGWECRTGRTFQVVLAGKKIDFWVNVGQKEYAIEYHPIHLHHEMRAGFEEYREALRHCPRQDVQAANAALSKHFLVAYLRERRLVLNLTGHEAVKLIVAVSPSDFYRRVLRPLAHCKAAERTIIKEFEAIVRAG